MFPIANETDDSSQPLWRQSHFYSHLGLLYPTVDARAVDYYALHSEDRVPGHSYPSLLAALPEEEAWGTRPYKTDPAWQSRFSLLQEAVLSNYRNTFACRVAVMCRTSTYYDKRWESSLSPLSLTSRKFSRFRVEYAVDAMSGWIRSSNICYERKKTTFHVYFLDGRRVDIRRYGKQCAAVASPSHVVFRYGWHFSFDKGAPPTENAYWFNDTDVYVGLAFRPRHITHFAEGVNLLLLKLLAPREFPKVGFASRIHRSSSTCSCPTSATSASTSGPSSTSSSSSPPSRPKPACACGRSRTCCAFSASTARRSTSASPRRC